MTFSHCCSAWQRTVSCRAPRSRALERPGLPDWSTLDKLEEHTGIGLWRWLIALRRTTLEEMAGALGREVPAEPLTATRHRWFSLIDADGWTDAGVMAMADVLDRMQPRVVPEGDEPGTSTVCTSTGPA